MPTRRSSSVAWLRSSTSTNRNASPPIRCWLAPMRPATRSLACGNRLSRGCCSTPYGMTAAVPDVRRRPGLICADNTLCSEIRQFVKLGVASSKHAAKGLGAGLQHISLLSHATYRREEVLAALQYGSLELGKNMQHREGVAWYPAKTIADWRHRALL
jgi:hypothetical protein